MSHPDRGGAASGRAGSSSRSSRAPLPTLPQSDSSKPLTSSPALNLSLQSRRALPVPKSFLPFVPPIQPSIPNITPSNTKRTTYRIQLKTIDLNKPTDREEILEVTFCVLDTPIIRLTKTRTGYYAVTDDATIIEKLTSNEATEAFEKINLIPIEPPDIRAKRIIYVRQIDPDIMKDSARLLTGSITIANEWLMGIEVIKIKDYIHIMKIVTPNIKTAERVLQEGFYLSRTKISPQQCELEKYTHIQICYKCYKFEDHPTYQCTAKTQYYSECASQEHTYQHCTNTFKKCLNCQGPHRTLAAGCTYRKTIINQKREDEQKQKEQHTHNTYPEIEKHAIQQTNRPQHALTLTNQTHLKLTALILEAHIAALDKTQKFGEILSKSLKANFDIDTTFPDRDSSASFNFYYEKTDAQQPHTNQTLSQETQKSHEPSKPQEPLKPQEQQSLSSLDISMDYNPQEPHVPSNKRRISDEIENSTVLIDNKYMYATSKTLLEY
ncbi:hypothetical protein FHG87_025632 [Trinorchestia longiramus]|nr:hypothetical protein FHG87_025632 [Trinorchestia longiramus]